MAASNQLTKNLDDLKGRSKSLSLYSLLMVLSSLKESNASSVKLNIHFNVIPELQFISREVLALDYAIKEDNEINCKISVGFFGLQGTHSPLPSHYSEQISQAESNDDVLNLFYNFFNQKLLALLYESNLKIDYKNQYRVTFADTITKRIMAMSALWHRYQEPTVPAFYKNLAQFSPYISQKKISQSDIKCIIKQYFNFEDVKIENFTLRNVPVDSDDQATLNSHANHLGSDFTIGKYKPDRMNSCTFHIRLADPIKFLPGTPKHQELTNLIAYILPRHILFNIILYTKEVISPVIGKNEVYLGWTFAVGKDIKEQTIKL